jgi:hypothetical protein
VGTGDTNGDGPNRAGETASYRVAVDAELEDVDDRGHDRADRRLANR